MQQSQNCIFYKLLAFKIPSSSNNKKHNTNVVLVFYLTPNMSTVYQSLIICVFICNELLPHICSGFVPQNQHQQQPLPH